MVTAANARFMEQSGRDWDRELEESAQGTDSFTAPGADLQVDEAREAAREAAGGDIDTPAASGRVERARVRRHMLGEAFTGLEAVVAGPLASEGWLEAVTEGLAELRRALEEHIEVTEGPGGLLEEIVSVAPRLAGETGLIEVEHRQLLETLERAESAAVCSTDAKAIRNRVMVIIPQLSLHRQRGADLVYEAYNVDIAAGD